MTLPGSDIAKALGRQSGVSLRSGDIVTLALHGGEAPVLSTTSMGTKERMLLQIPLDPDLLGPADWTELPGIGPVLAGRIIADRHNNGAFGSLEGLLRVPGIGPGRLAAIRKYF
jgi:competence protein ComEA